MSTATCTSDVQGPSVGENEVNGEPGSVRSRVEAAGNGAEQPGRSRGSARQEEAASAVGQDANPAAASAAGSESCATKTAAQRDAKGRFLPGNFGGPGNPFARQLAKFRSFIIKSNTEEHMTFAFNKMMEMIADGNVGALKLYFLYTIGKPADAVDPDKLDLDEWDGYKATAGMLDEASALMKAPNSELPVTLLRFGKAAVTQKMREFACHNLEHPEEMQKAKEEAARKQQEELDKAIQRANALAAVARPELAARGMPVPVVRSGGPPSANGGNGHADPRASQSLSPRLGGDEPSSNGGNGHASPSANGGNGHADPRASQSLSPRLEGDAPSSNGGNGHASPSTNGGNGEADVAEALAEEFEAILGRLRHSRPAA